MSDELFDFTSSGEETTTLHLKTMRVDTENMIKYCSYYNGLPILWKFYGCGSHSKLKKYSNNQGAYYMVKGKRYTTEYLEAHYNWDKSYSYSVEHNINHHVDVDNEEKKFMNIIKDLKREIKEQKEINNGLTGLIRDNNLKDYHKLLLEIRDELKKRSQCLGTYIDTQLNNLAIL